ncbi:outer dense fiber protein 3-like [Lucilia sericata]|uniref:outer dense fiber protein 3-like n=1 Tax=Lucilia sericata TaxID=13632 RepID=UPI0018A7F4C2|nr:outer dense fiber protein 3-like [Lucilia sericata]
MVYNTPTRLKSPIKGPCEKIPQTKRPIRIGANIEQKPWQPTTRRGRIAAEYIPGKPAYRSIPAYLGSYIVDSKKKSAPAYSLGKRIIRKQDYTDDGPDKFNIRGLCNKGLQTAPAFSLKSRRADIKRFQAPPANKYSIEKALKATTKTIPTFSFGKRPVAIKTIPTPGPNVYNLPPVFGTAKQGEIKAAPAFTMLGRKKPRQIPTLINPGPGDYENNYRYLQNFSPRYTLHSKHKVISDEHMKPGPAAHCPEKYFKHKSVAAPSFSIHHTPYLGQRKAYLMQENRMCTKPEWIL